VVEGAEGLLGISESVPIIEETGLLRPGGPVDIALTGVRDSYRYIRGADPDTLFDAGASTVFGGVSYAVYRKAKREEALRRSSGGIYPTSTRLPRKRPRMEDEPTPIMKRPVSTFPETEDSDLAMSSLIKRGRYDRGAPLRRFDHVGEDAMDLDDYFPEPDLPRRRGRVSQSVSCIYIHYVRFI